MLVIAPNSFDSNYFKNLIKKNGFHQLDQVLFSGGSTDSIVNGYNKSLKTYSFKFASTMVKMGDIEPLPGTTGEIHKFCNVTN